MIFIPAFQFTSKEKVSEGKNFDQSKKVKEPKDDRARASDRRIENDAGKTSCSCVFNLICDMVSMPRKHKKEGQASDVHDILLHIKMPYICASQIEASPRANPGHLNFWKIFVSMPPLPGPKSCSSAPS